ncbi:hypothetical protein LVJ94_38175 [Pendulispora rubella]|uniref:Lipoprotein n=1 Tax=Pendulispora rubella TaxID=2741070 RepID=A0ABZ2L299_9BACT
MMIRTSALLAVLLVSACSRSQEPEKHEPAPAPQAPAALSATATTTQATGHEIVWDAPPSWEKVANPSTMRKATYRIPKAAGDTDDTELSVIVAGGSATANIERWVGQFSSGASIEKKERSVSNLNVSVVEIKGTYGGGMTGPGMPAAAGPKEHYALLGAIVADGQDSTFFKMTGPEKSVKAARADFDKFVDSLKKR